MSNPFTGYNSNPRIVALPIIPSSCDQVPGLGAADSAYLAVLTLSAANLNNGTVRCYLHYCCFYARQTAAGASQLASIRVQFLAAAAVPVGGPVDLLIFSTASSGGTNTLSHALFTPPVPKHQQLSIPATAIQLAVFAHVFATTGVPVSDGEIGVGIDLINNATPGEIGGDGLATASPSSPNTF